MVKDHEEIEQQSNILTFFSTIANAQLSDNNRPKALAKVSSLSQITNVNADISDAKSIAESEATNFKDIDPIVTLLASGIDEGRVNKRKDQKAKQTNVAKRAKIPDEIFNYIHVA